MSAHYIFTYYIVISISVPIIRTRKPIKPPYVLYASFPFFFSMWDYVPFFSFNFRTRGTTRYVGSECVDYGASMRWTLGPRDLHQRTCLNCDLSEPFNESFDDAWTHHDRPMKIQRMDRNDAPLSSRDVDASQASIADQTLTTYSRRFINGRFIWAVDRDPTVDPTVTPNSSIN